MKRLSYLLILLLIYSCSGHQFYKRQYLHGRYKDKVEKPENSAKTSNNQPEFELVEYTSVANSKDEILINQIDEIEKPITLLPDTSNKDSVSRVNNQFKFFESDSIKYTKLKYLENINEENAQGVFNAYLKKAGVRLAVYYFYRLVVSVISAVFFFNFSTLALSPFTLVVLGLVLLLSFMFSMLFLYNTFDTLIDADRIRSRFLWLKNNGWFYFLLGLCILFMFTSLYLLLVLGVLSFYNLFDNFF